MHLTARAARARPRVSGRLRCAACSDLAACVAPSGVSKRILAAVRHVQEAIVVLALVIDLLQCCDRGRKGPLIDEQEDRLLRRQLDSLANNIYKLANR